MDYLCRLDLDDADDPETPPCPEDVIPAGEIERLWIELFEMVLEDVQWIL